ncbi:TraQ conjugal transfer family protein [Dysgonomonas sp. 25]|uniref:TraQ conjugal transfer family protein n=1 Tax=Dysgonomonas sp. 25 TaxID=2302933 RepID=UPI0013D404AA|nr:TraQ conjugal transfer family protein [Dysgonomonas sp. 25]NDV69936.1 DUF3872 domain-containing protein [Dysgonomonas sp. 25]
MKNRMIYFFAIFLLITISCSTDKDLPDDYYGAYTITQSPVKASIAAGETVAVTFQINRPKNYKDKFYLLYNQDSDAGVGKLVYNNITLNKATTYEIKQDQVTVYYSAVSENYHRLTLSVIDGNGVQETIDVVFNDDKKGIDDKLFSIEKLPNQLLIAENESAEIKYHLKRSKIYEGKYYIRYNQYNGNGSGILRYNGSLMIPGYPIEIKNDSIQLLYTAITLNYHRLDFTFFDEQGIELDSYAVFNEEKKGIDDYLPVIKGYTDKSILDKGETATITLNVDRSRLYDGNYYIKYKQSQYGTGVLKLGGTEFEQESISLITNGNLTLTYTATNKLCHLLEFVVIDETGREVICPIYINKDKKDRMDGFDIIDNSPSKAVNPGTSCLILLDLDRWNNQTYSGKYYFSYKLLKGDGMMANPVEASQPQDTKVEIRYTKGGFQIQLFFRATNIPEKIYHQILLSIYDDTGCKQDMILTFNDSLKN